MLFDDMVHEVLPELPGCPDEAVSAAFRRVCGDFMRRTQAATELRLLTVTPGASLSLSSQDSVVTDILKVDVNGTEGTVFGQNDPRVAEFASGEFGPAWDGRFLWITPEQTTSVEILATVVTMPGPNATSIADYYWWHYGTCLSHGVRGRLMAQPNKPWSDKATAAFELAEYERQVIEHGMKAGMNRQHSARRLRVQQVDSPRGSVGASTTTGAETLARIKSGPFLMDGVTTDFTLMAAPGTIENLDVFADGFRLPDGFSLVGDVTLRFTPALAAGIEVYTWSTALPR